MLNALSRRKTWKWSKGLPQFSSIFFMFSLILKQFWEPSISLQCKARCLYSKLSKTLLKKTPEKILSILSLWLPFLFNINRKIHPQENNLYVLIYWIKYILSYYNCRSRYNIFTEIFYTIMDCFSINKG